MIIDTSQTSDKVIQDLKKWEAQLMKQRKYINEKIDEIERIIKENQDR